MAEQKQIVLWSRKGCHDCQATIRLQAQPVQDPLVLAKKLAEEWRQTAAERDVKGGTAKEERDQIRKSGLLLLSIPREYGGPQIDWRTIIAVVQEIARVDASLAHVLGYHYLQLATPHMYGSKEQWERYYRDTLKHNWFWGNAINPRDQRVTIRREGRGYRLNGVKSFCSGSGDADVLVVSANREEDGQRLVLVLPTRRDGVVVKDDWDGFGQRQTDSGSVEFHQVWVGKDDILLDPGPGGTPFSTMRTPLTQLMQAAIFVGVAEGALLEAKKFTSSTPRVWSRLGHPATEDPYILHRFGDLWIRVQAAIHLLERAVQVTDSAWKKQEDLTAEERGECAIAVYSAKAFAAQTGLDVTSQIFEVMGARATLGSLRYDRFWRNIRTLSLHDPVDYKLQEAGRWFLNGEYPKPEFYS